MHAAALCMVSQMKIIILHKMIKKMQKLFREIEDSNSYILLVLWSQIENVEKGFSIIYPDVLFQFCGLLRIYEL